MTRARVQRRPGLAPIVVAGIRGPVWIHAIGPLVDAAIAESRAPLTGKLR